MIDPNDPIIKHTRKSLRRIWNVCIFFPPTYWLVCWAINHWWFTPKEMYFGMLGLSHKASYLLILLVGVAAGLIQWAIVGLKRIAARRMSDEEMTPAIFAAHLRTRTYLLLALCDTVALLGVIVFLMGGLLLAPFIFGMLSMLYYLQCRPEE
jgi:hypothetical protein